MLPSRLPRKFKPRVLLAIVSVGICIFLLIRYFPTHFDYNTYHINHAGFRLRVPSMWWHMWHEQLGCAGSGSEGSGGSHVLDTADAYAKLDFSLPENGGSSFWNKDMEERYRRTRESWKDLPLEVIVVPQSHVDPGWLRTYDDYYENSVSRILSNMVDFLNKTKEFKFIWSEVSYFATWWKGQSKATQESVKKILARNQLEIVTGGWVMTDEATTHYSAVIDQLIEGHQWLKHHTNVTPQHAWSVDVFGHSASLPYILSKSGLTEMVILRAHYAWKAFLAKMQHFDFYWEQAFESSRMLCHMAPSDLYSFKHTCGPDPAVCLQYDFRRVHGEFSESTAVDITHKNIKMKAEFLLSQYGRYASLYPHNVLLVPLGDDFRYNFYIEWVKQFENYQKLFDFINNKKEWNARVRFGTIRDYFDEVNWRLKANDSFSLPTIRGDFFPYADIYADYHPSFWTGFYSTRPFYKKLSQELEHWLRTSEILYSFAKTIVPYQSMKKLIEDYSFIVSARQNLALFQHHDAITGTSKAAVMADYGNRMHLSIINVMSVTSHITQFLMVENQPEENVTWTSQVYPDLYRPTYHGPTEKIQISVLNHGRKILLFNSLTKERSDIVRLKVKSPYLKVLDEKQNEIPFQINPIWNNDFTIANNLFELVFPASLKPLSFSTYTLIKISENEMKLSSKAEISLFYDDISTFKQSVFNFKQPYGEHITLESSEIRATFSSSGHLKTIYMKQHGLTKALNIDFKSYVPKQFRSGGYLFHPKLNYPVSLNNITDHYPLVYAIHGPLVSELTFMNNPFLTFSIRLYNFYKAPPGLHMDITLDISKVAQESEMVMQIKSDVKNNGVFYTDSNNLQMLKRTYVNQLPVQGNYYPATSAIYIEDEGFRLTLLIPHSHGVSSTDEGVIEVMLDRTMKSDDGRGMSEGVQDNQRISTSFWLLPEAITGRNFELPCLSRNAHISSLNLLHPIVILMTENVATNLVRSELSFLPRAWPAHTHLVNLRSLHSDENYNLPSNSSLLIICKKLVSCKVHDNTYDESIEKVSLVAFSRVNVGSVIRTSLTGGYFKSESKSGNSAETRLYTYKISFR